MPGRKAFVLLELMNAMVLVAQEAKRRGHLVVALNHDPLQSAGPFAVPDGLVDELIAVESWSQRDALRTLISELAERYQVVGTYSVFEPTLPTEAALRELARLPTTSVANVERVLDKAQVRRKLYDEGLSELASVSLTEALSWSEWAFPTSAVLKPAHGTGSALCFIVSSLAELRAAAEQVAAAEVVNPLMRDYIVAHGEFVLEQRAEGELLSVESVICDGEVQLIGLTGRYLLASNPVVEQGLFFPYKHPMLDDLVARSEALHKSLEISHGTSHLEMMVCDNGTIELIDFNPRFAGFASTVAFGEAYRTPFESVLTDLACGQRPDLSFLDRPPRYAVEIVIMPPPGVRRLDEISFPPQLIAARATKSIGQELSGRSDQLDAVGMAIVVADTPRQADQLAWAARRAVVLNGQTLADNPNNVVVCPRFLAGSTSSAPDRNSQ